MAKTPKWERELMAIPPSCMCHFVDTEGLQVLDCRIHPTA